MSVVAAVVVLMMLVVVLMGLCGKFFFLHWLPLHFFHDVIEGHSKYLPDMGIVQGVIDDSPPMEITGPKCSSADPAKQGRPTPQTASCHQAGRNFFVSPLDK